MARSKNGFAGFSRGSNWSSLMGDPPQHAHYPDRTDAQCKKSSKWSCRHSKGMAGSVCFPSTRVRARGPEVWARSGYPPEVTQVTYSDHPHSRGQADEGEKHDALH